MDNVINIPLANGHIVLIDSHDLTRFERHRWDISPSTVANQFYVATHPTKNATLYLHRYLLGAAKTELVDHINRNPLDNRRINLRLCTHSQSSAHTSRKPNKNGYRGVDFQSPHGRDRWQAQVTCRGKVYRSSWKNNPLAAAVAYDELATKYFGEFAVLNFPKPEIS